MNLIKRLSLSLFSLIFLAVLIDVTMYMLLPAGSTHRWAVPDKRYGHFQRKSFHQTVRYWNTNVTWDVRINSLGLRGPEHDFSNHTSMRILLLGDSFTFGYGLNEEDTFSGKLQALFREAGHHVMVINAGVAGWGTTQELLFARDHMDLFQPDVVVITFCGNDPVDDQVFGAGASGGILPGFPGKRFLRDYSFLYGLVYNALYERLFEVKLETDREDVRPDINPPAEVELPHVPISQNAFSSTIRQIEDFRRDLAAARPDSLLLIQAAEFWKEDIRDTLSHLHNSVDMFYVDLSVKAGGIAASELYLAYDPHWNERMHDFSAQALFEAITNAPQMRRFLP